MLTIAPRLVDLKRLKEKAGGQPRAHPLHHLQIKYKRHHIHLHSQLRVTWLTALHPMAWVNAVPHFQC